VYVELDGQGPRYAQLIRALKSAILEGRLAPGSRVPASRNLAGELGISRNTVLAAYEQLQAEGFVLARVGSGSFVADIGNRRTSRSHRCRQSRAGQWPSAMPPPRCWAINIATCATTCNMACR